MYVQRVATPPIAGMKPGTGGLRKRVPGQRVKRRPVQAQMPAIARAMVDIGWRREGMTEILSASLWS